MQRSSLRHRWFAPPHTVCDRCNEPVPLMSAALNSTRRLEVPLTEEARRWNSTYCPGGTASAFRRPCNCPVDRCSFTTSATPITPSVSRRVEAVTRRRRSTVIGGSCPVKHRNCRNRRAMPRLVNVDTSITRTVAMVPTVASGTGMTYGRWVHSWQRAVAVVLARGGE